MGLRDDIQKDVAAALDGDLAEVVTAFAGERESISDSYDPETGGYPVTQITYSGRGVFGGYRQEEIDGQHILRTDTKLYGVLQNELRTDADGAVTAPAVDDTINGMTVINFKQDPASVAWVLQLRAT